MVLIFIAQIEEILIHLYTKKHKIEKKNVLAQERGGPLKLSNPSLAEVEKRPGINRVNFF
jgi:hypothetical protein